MNEVPPTKNEFTHFTQFIHGFSPFGLAFIISLFSKLVLM